RLSRVIQQPEPGDPGRHIRTHTDIVERWTIWRDATCVAIRLLLPQSLVGNGRRTEEHAPERRVVQSSVCASGFRANDRREVGIVGAVYDRPFFHESTKYGRS